MNTLLERENTMQASEKDRQDRIKMGFCVQGEFIEGFITSEVSELLICCSDFDRASL